MPWFSFMSRYWTFMWRRELHRRAERSTEVRIACPYPRASKQTGWQWFFPARERSRDPRSGKAMRQHVLELALQKAVKRASKKAGIDKRVGCHTLRHSFATHMLENGVNIRVLQDLLVHADVKTTEIRFIERLLNAPYLPVRCTQTGKTGQLICPYKIADFLLSAPALRGKKRPLRPPCLFAGGYKQE
jgi:integrase